MKKTAFLYAAAVLFILLPCMLNAQISMKIQMSQKYYLQYEGVFVKVGLKNYSAHPLAFGEANGLNGEITFLISTVGARYQDYVMPYSRKIKPDMRGVILPPGGTRYLTFNLGNIYDLRKTGRYTLKAVVSHSQLKSKYESNSEFFIIVPGTEVWSTTVGLPDLSGEGIDPSKKVKTRKYRLISYYTGKVTVYAVSMEDEKNVYFLKRIAFDLGRELQPQCEVDFLSRLNLMIAASPKIFAYYQYSPEGKLEKKQIYIKTGTTPVLAVDKDNGTVVPVGGREARKDLDYEEIRLLPFMENMDTGAAGSVFGSDSMDKTINPTFNKK